MSSFKRMLVFVLVAFFVNPAVADRATFTTLAKLLVAPETTQDRLVSVVGVMGKPEVGGYAVYLDRESQQNDVTINAVWLRFAEGETAEREADAAVGRYVMVTGIADAKSPRSPLFPCLLMEVTRVVAYPLLKPLSENDDDP